MPSTCFSMDPVTVLRMSQGLFVNYNYLILDPGSRQAVIVDPAWQMGKIEDALAAAGATLAGILVTHSHPDHVHLAGPLAQKFGCPIWMSEREIAVSGFRAPRLAGISGAAWSFGQTRIQPILTPGHTPGCVCYLIGDSLFTGDVLFAEGCGMCPDVPAAHDMFASLEHLKNLGGPDLRIYPGHSYGKEPGRPFSQIRKENLYLQFSDPESFSAFRLRKGQNRKGFFAFL